MNIKEYRDSFSYEKFNFRSNPNITFYVYVSNFSWPIKIQVSTPRFISGDVEYFHGGISSLACAHSCPERQGTQDPSRIPPMMICEDEWLVKVLLEARESNGCQ